MKIDGLLSSNEFDELTKVGKLWHELIELSYCYHTGSGSSKKRIIELLLELYSLKQITKEVFVNTCITIIIFCLYSLTIVNTIEECP